MYEVDFLPVESESGPGSKSGDAIAMRLAPENAPGSEFVVVIDGGYSSVGDNLVQHIGQFYDTEHVDLVISTHPDADHINGLLSVVENCDVDELWIHRPRLHRSDVSDYSNIEAIDNLVNAAEKRGTTVREPFTGLTAFDERITVIGPTQEYYEGLLGESLAKVRASIAEKATSLSGSSTFQKVVQAAASALDKTLAALPFETLTDAGETDPRNNTSVVTLIEVDEKRLLFTGDAGMPALEHAADYFEQIRGLFALVPLRFIQVPHHGSKRNVGPTILNRILGKAGSPYSVETAAVISSAKASEKHPAAKVVNAFARRGCHVTATEGRIICHQHNASRPGWTAIDPIPPLDESGEDE